MKLPSFLTLAHLIVSSASANPVPSDATCINQVDFESGTLIITTPGAYKLCEDIIFNPNAPAPGALPAEDAFDPIYSGDYEENEYGLGFFSAISIATSDVTIHLNDHSIEQSAGHALMQRFFAIIELASSPFLPAVGPAQFVSSTFKPATNVKILGPGTIGRSSHHGIHGNENSNIQVSSVNFIDFEVAAVSLNNVDTLEISDCNIIQNRQDVPVVGLFSAARFIRTYGKFLKESRYKARLYNSSRGKTKWLKASDAYDRLITSIGNVYDDVINGNGQIDEAKHPEEYHLFHNPKMVVDGPAYAFLVHGKGPAVGGQGEIFNEADATTTSSNIVIKNNKINNVKAWNNEVPALFGECENNGCIVNDARGAVFQTVKTFDDENPYLAMDANGRYQGNVVADMQMIVAQAILDGTLTNAPSRQIGPNSINQEICDWAKDGTVLTPQYVCNGDSMHHVVKGMIVIRVEDAVGFSIEGNSITNVENLSVAPYGTCDDYHIGASSENPREFQAGNIRAISVAAARGFENSPSQIKNNEVGRASSNQESDGLIIGIDVQGDTKDTVISGNTVDLGENIFENDSDEYIALRVREAVDGSVSVNANNNFSQETKILNAAIRMRGRARNLKKSHPDTSEWDLGGCPYSKTYAKKRAM